MKLNMKLNRLEKITRKDFTARVGKPDVAPKSGSGIDLIEKRSHFPYNIDFRGKRGEDTVAELIRLIDDALILNIHEFRIVHGKGDGILRQLIRTELKKYKQFSFTDEHADRGGDGVTIVTMN